MCEEGQLTDLEIEIRVDQQRLIVMLESFGLNKGREDLKTRKMKKDERNKLKEMKTKLRLERV